MAKPPIILLEILPRIYLEIPPALGRRYGLKLPIMPIPLRHIPSQQIPLERLMQRNTLSGLGGRKYPLQLLDEAVRVTAEVGIAQASKLTGVSQTAINNHRQARRIEAGKPAVVNPGMQRHVKWTLEQKRACVLLALKLIASRGPKVNRRGCWKLAGIRLGMNGESVQKMYERGLFSLCA